MRCGWVRIGPEGDLNAAEFSSKDPFKASYSLTAYETPCGMGVRYTPSDFMRGWYGHDVARWFAEQLFANPERYKQVYNAVMNQIRADKTGSAQLPKGARDPGVSVTMDEFVKQFLRAGVLDVGLTTDAKDLGDDPPYHLKFTAPVWRNVFYSAKTDEEKKEALRSRATKNEIEVVFANDQREMTADERKSLLHDAIMAPLFKIRYTEGVGGNNKIFQRPELFGAVYYGKFDGSVYTERLGGVRLPPFPDADKAVDVSLDSFTAPTTAN